VDFEIVIDVFVS